MTTVGPPSTHLGLRVAPNWAPKRAERGPYTGRGERAVGLLGDRTRNLALHIESKIHDIRFFDDIVFAFEPKQSLLLHLRF